ncbi:Dynein heavy chain 7 axonemal [Taenia solium]|eukprot:TsM_000873000 transcript=TsM_000873000 gene=TsM_000873000
MNFANPWHKEYMAHRIELREHLMLLYPQMAKVLDVCDKFFSSMQVADIKQFLLQNLDIWINLFDENHRERLPVLKMYLTFENQCVKFFPGYEDLEELLLSVAKYILESMPQVPTVHSILYRSDAPRYIDTGIAPHIMEACQTRLKNAARFYFEPAERFFHQHIGRFCNSIESHILAEPYSYIFDGTEAKLVEDFLNKDPEFRDYRVYVTKLHDLAHDINHLPDVEYFDLIRLDCEDVKTGISKECMRLANKLLETLANKLRQVNREVCASFEEMQAKCQTIPQTSEELIEINSYMEEARCQGMVRMEQKIQWTREYLIYLLDVYEFTPEDIKTNSQVLTWKARINPEFDAHDKMQENMRTVNEQRINAKREQLESDLKRLRNRVDEFNDYGEVDAEMMTQYANDVRVVFKRVSEAESLREWINKEEKLYQIPISPFSDIEEIKALAEPFHRLFTSVVKYNKSERRWMYGEFDKLDAEVIEDEVDETWREMFRLQKVFDNRLKKMRMEADERRRERNERLRRRMLAASKTEPTSTPVDEEAAAVATITGGAAEDEEIPEVKPPAALQTVNFMLERLKKFKDIVPVIRILCNPGIRQRHWDAMSAIANRDLTPDSGTSLSKMLQMNLTPYMEQFEAISVGASKEHTLEVNLVRMREDWTDVCFTLTPYRDHGFSILASVDDIQQQLDDQIVKTQTMRGSPFIKPFEMQLKKWEEQLLRIQGIIDSWLVMQANWLYLEPIFSSEDIMQQMPEEGRLFVAVDKTYRDIMRNAAMDAHVLKATSMVGLLERIREGNTQFDRINKGLNAYLDKKRLFFPRFFFLSNDEMLEILSETKDPQRVQPHLKKCFEGIAKLEFDKNLEIKAMFSGEGEKVVFSQNIDTAVCRGAVEKWLLQVQDVMVLSVHDVIASARDAYDSDLRDVWVLDWPGQVVLCVSQIFWTLEVSEAIAYGQAEGLASYKKKLDSQIAAIVRLVRGKLSTQERITLGALVVIDVHARDTVQTMAQNKVTDDNDFQWLSQLRYYWEEDNCLVRLTNAVVPYAYEYLGNSTRLVITPLTDRCYRTLIGAYHLHLNGAPEGPAGTGKTETTKDLAKAIAVQCVVFNCSDGLDYIAMGKGLASSGAWACFDEFNRIELEVLSVIAQQILCIIRAIQANLEVFEFEGTVLSLNPNCYVCITMNPGYAGRSELPDNLKILFRPVAMMVPDYAMIGEISLYSYGFMDARNLAGKIVTTYRLCSEQLSSQSHYDYGMRAVKAVLHAAGNLKLRHPEENEMILLLRSIMDVNVPKFLSHDIPLFRGIISDLFPGVILPDADYSDFLEEAAIVCQRNGLQAVPTFTEKLIQTYEMMIVRHGFMLVGMPLGGKTKILHTLAEVMTGLFEKGDTDYAKVFYRTINPKSITMGQLFGEFDPVSHEWTDGVTANTFREYANMEPPDRTWVIFDGPIDTLWIESMNTVLDDNKKLCLMSGEIIQMSKTMSLIFETMDLLQASPATVSRCGMIYVEPLALGWRPLATSWLGSLPESMILGDGRKALQDLFDWLFDPCLEFIQVNCRQLIPISAMCSIKSTLDFLSALIIEPANAEGAADNRYLRLWTHASLLFSIVWGIGGCLDENSRIKFDDFIKPILGGKVPELPVPQSIGGRCDFQMPDTGLVYDYFFEFKSRGKWKHWNELSRGQSKFEGMEIRDIIVPTMDTARYKYLVDICLTSRQPLSYIGVTGTGKSAYVREKLMRDIDDETYRPFFINFSAQTSANQVQDIIMSKLDRRRKGVYGLPFDKIATFFIDDLNMPAKEVYGAQPPIELLRTFMDHGFVYDLDDMSKIQLVNLYICAAMGPPGGGRNDVTPRFMRHFHAVSMVPFSDVTLTRIFTTLIQTYLRAHEFTSDYYVLGNTMVDATLNVYKAAISNLLPTPAKSHYVFNLRDFSRVILGICLIKKECVKDKQTFIRLWVHEVLRVFYDRLTDEMDRQWLVDFIKNTIDTSFKDKVNMVFSHLLANIKDEVTEETFRSLIFGDFMDIDSLPEERNYEEVMDINTMYPIVEQCLADYNATHKTKMNLVIFRYVLEHLARICRVLRVPSGNALLIGVGGSGRQSLSRLASAMAGYATFQPEVTKDYGLQEWREDVKSCLKNAGGRGMKTVFLMTDMQIKNEIFLEDVDNLLNSGEVPNIFTSEERAEVTELVQAAIEVENRKNAATPGGGGPRVTQDMSPLALFTSFVNRCRANLHVIIAFSPIGNAFRNRLRQFPSLINCCTIDWFTPWPEDALERVARRSLESLGMEAQLRDSVTLIFKHFHTSIANLSEKFFVELGRKTYVTPTSYLEQIASFERLITKKKNEIMMAKTRYLNGLDKLAFGASQVADMQVKLEELQPQLVEAGAANERLLVVIARESAAAEQQRERVVQEEEVVNSKADASKALSEECRADLAEAQPAMEAALAALDTLKPADITIVKSMANPPFGVKLVMEAVCVMRDIKPDRINDPSTGKKILDYWGPSKRLLGDLNFLLTLKEYDKDNIPAQIITNIRNNYITNPEFDPAKVARASSAAEGLCKWILAMEQYDRVAKIVAPKKVKLAAAEQELAENMAALKETQASLKAVEDKLAKLHENLDNTQAEKKRLEDEVELCGLKLVRAKKLIGGLGGEKERWSQAAEWLQHVYDNLTGDVLVSAGVIAYLGPFTSTYRDACIEDWVGVCNSQPKITCSSHFSLTNCLGDPVKIQAWNIFGLPRDAFSIDNSVIVDNGRRWPLMIDPEGQANKWIKNMEKENAIAVVKLNDSDFMRRMENSVQFGVPVLLENVGEELDPSLESLLLKQTFKQGAVDMIKLGENIIEYSSDFRFYITTKLRNPHYLPEVAVKVSLLNFMITPEGLEDQLLGIVVAKEKPELEEARQELIVTTSNNKRMLKEAEDRILATLAEAEGNILENETAIQTLDSSKAISDEIMQKQAVADETHKKIDLARMDYSPIARHSAILFSSITDLPNIDPMYQYSLSWFVNLYVNAIQDSNKSKILERRLRYIQEYLDYKLYSEVCRGLFEKHKLVFSLSLCARICFNKSKIVEKRIRYLIDYFTYSLYVSVCRSVFEKHKLLFSLLLCCKLMMAKDEIHLNEFLFFLTGGVGLENTAPNPAPQWLTSTSWDEICRLSDLSPFVGLKEHVTANTREWQKFYDSKAPHNTPLPPPWNNNLDQFRTLIILRCIRPDKVVPAVTNYVREKLGKKFVEPPQFDLAKSYEDSTSTAPLIFVLSPGADPTMALLRFAHDKGFGGTRFQSISLGQGQGPIAAKMIERAQMDGSWVLLQNCHLAVSWMPKMEKICEGFTVDNTVPTFRLWLTSYPSPNFPVTVLQNGVKITNEPPSGLRQNLLQSYLSDPLSDLNFFYGCPNNEATFEKLVYGLCFFHALVQERRHFGPIGWNIPYGFNESDLHISVRQLQIFINEYEQVPFEAINYLTGECNYGGRVTDERDRRCLLTILLDFYCPALITETKYKLPTNPNYFIPPKMEYHEYIEFIKNLPSVQTPEVFGLHENVDIMRQHSETKALLAATLLTVTSTGSGGGSGQTVTGSSDSQLNDIASDIISKLPAPFDIDAASKRYPLVYQESMNTVLVQEMERYNNLTLTIRQSLLNLQKALSGLEVMSAELEQLVGSLMVGRIPNVWAARSYPSLKPLGSYIIDLCERLAFFQRWYENSKPPTFWVSGFFFTQAFLTGVLQNYARQYTIPIDLLVFDFDVQSVLNVETPPKEGTYINGLFADGFRWDYGRRHPDKFFLWLPRMKLGDQLPKVLNEVFPAIHLLPVPKNKSKMSTMEDSSCCFYMCPVYKTSERRGVLSTTGHSTNFVLPIFLPSQEHESFWIKRGAALLCQLDN